MQLARRVALGALAALLAGLALTGCRSEPSVAVYVGNVRYTHADIDRIVNPAAERKGPAVPVSPQWVVRLVVTRDLAKQLVAEKNLEVEPVDLSRALNMASDDEYARLWNEVLALELALWGSVTPVSATDEDLARVYRAIVQAGLLDPDLPASVVRQQLGGPELAAWLGVRTLIADAVASHHVTVNPRFAPLAMPLLLRGSGGQPYQIALPFPLDTTTGVRDSG